MPRVFHGWWMVAAGFGLEFLIGALLFHAYGAYAVLLREEFGWSKTLLAGAFSMARAESGILGPIQGWLTDRFGPRALIRVGMVVFAVGLGLFSRIDGPVAFFATFFMMAVGTSLGGYLPISVAIVTWFRRRRALALSISGMGMALGGLSTPLVVAALTRFGHRDDDERWTIQEWLAWDNQRMTGGPALLRYQRRFVTDTDPAVLTFLQGRAERALGQLAAGLAATGWLVGGRPTIADIAACAYAFWLDEAGLDAARWPSIPAWLDRIRALPGFAPAGTLMKV